MNVFPFSSSSHFNLFFGSPSGLAVHFEVIVVPFSSPLLDSSQAIFQYLKL